MGSNCSYTVDSACCCYINLNRQAFEKEKARTNTASAPARLAFVKEFARLHKSENVGLISYSRFVSVHKIIWKTLAEGSLWIQCLLWFSSSFS